ncbi:hypothetical protein [Actinoplanes sp. NPDC020271]|uniref:hypothetical protein n=1 Tax=Actinoplanes sp. NPDC020271 TaxID=3363896 RepID=UPI0037B683F0
MTPDEAVRAMAARLGAINWDRHGDKAWSKAVLLKEYFRRAARWAAAYGCDSPVPFFDIAACVDSTVRADRHLIDDVVADANTRGSRSVKRLLPFILHWSAIRPTLDADLLQRLEDPFEPLILLFERGGGFHTANGEVDLELKSVRMAGWRGRADDPPITSFAADDLDQIDRDGSIAQFGRVIEPL